MELLLSDRPGFAPAPSPDPSPWVARWAHLITPGGTVLDVAAGGGRHAAFLASRGHAVTAVDRDTSALARLAPGVEVVAADLERDAWPLPGRCFDAVVVTNYLWRPLFPALLAAIAPSGVLLYETFAAGQESVGRPKRAEFLLERGELIRLAAGLSIVAFEDGFLEGPARFVQRLAAVRAGTEGGPPRHPLAPAGEDGRRDDPAR